MLLPTASRSCSIAYAKTRTSFSSIWLQRELGSSQHYPGGLRIFNAALEYFAVLCGRGSPEYDYHGSPKSSMTSLIGLHLEQTKRPASAAVIDQR